MWSVVLRGKCNKSAKIVSRLYCAAAMELGGWRGGADGGWLAGGLNLANNSVFMQVTQIGQKISLSPNGRNAEKKPPSARRRVYASLATKPRLEPTAYIMEQKQVYS